MAEDNILPSYKETLEEIGRQLKFRKKLLVKRTITIIWPIAIFFLLVFLFLYLFMRMGMDFLQSWIWGPLAITLGVWLLFAVIYYVTVAWIFSVERLVWVKSFFTKEQLSPEQSWRKAKKLSLPALSFTSKIFLRFYLLPLVGYIGFVIASVVILLQLKNAENFLLPILIIWIGVGIPVAIYLYYLKVKKLKFIWFIFLDFHEDKKRFRELLEINNHFNEIKESDVFKRSLTLNLGVDTVRHAIDTITMSVLRNLERFAVRGAERLQLPGLGIFAVAVGRILEVFTQELSGHITELSRSIAIYMLYQHVWDTIEKEEDRD